MNRINLQLKYGKIKLNHSSKRSTAKEGFFKALSIY